MVAVPAVIAVTLPVVGSTLATAASLLVHVPPNAALVNNDVVPVHIGLVPVMALIAGNGLTVTVAEATSVPQLLVTV